MTLLLFWGVVALALAFGITNGFMVGGSLLSAIVSTRSLDPLAALVVVAGGEILGAFLLGQAVVRTLGNELVSVPAAGAPNQILWVLVSALVGALAWNLLMWRLALPTSSGHAFVGAIAGAFCVAFGTGHVHWLVLVRILAILGVIPVASSALGYGLARMGYWLGEFMTPAWAPVFRVVQAAALAGTAVTHGSNDGQKTMVMIGLAMAAAGRHVPGRPLPWPVTLFCGGALAVGLVLGARRIVQTLGQKLYHVQPLQGVCAQTATMLVVGMSSLAGYPMSSSQTISTSLLGAGVAVHPRAIRWEVVSEIGLAWVVTVPAAGLAAGTLAGLLRIFHVVS